MVLKLNSDQRRGLASFFFDVAKGLVLGGVGFTVVTAPELKVITAVFSSIFAYIFVRFALSLLENI